MTATVNKTPNWGDRIFGGVVIFFLAMGAFFIIATALAKHEPTTPIVKPVPTTSPYNSVSASEKKACADQAVFQFPHDKAQQEFALTVCLSLVKDHEDQVKALQGK